jgi:hypothetical protein
MSSSVLLKTALTALFFGRRVVGEINAGCGNCDLCRAGDSRHCANRTVLGIHGRDGAHAEFLKLPAVNLMPFLTTSPTSTPCSLNHSPQRAAYSNALRSTTRSSCCHRRRQTRIAVRASDRVDWSGRAPHRKTFSKLRIAERRGIEITTPNSRLNASNSLTSWWKLQARQVALGSRSICSVQRSTGSEVDFSWKNGTGRCADRG